MKQWFIDLFSESPRVSSNRVMSMLICIVGCFVVLHGMLVIPVDYNGIAILSCSLFTIALGGHVASKYAEVADHKANTTTKTIEVKDEA